jgi:hypothetical protein
VKGGLKGCSHGVGTARGSAPCARSRLTHCSCPKAAARCIAETPRLGVAASTCHKPARARSQEAHQHRARARSSTSSIRIAISLVDRKDAHQHRTTTSRVEMVREPPHHAISILLLSRVCRGSSLWVGMYISMVLEKDLGHVCLATRAGVVQRRQAVGVRVSDARTCAALRRRVQVRAHRIDLACQIVVGHQGW